LFIVVLLVAVAMRGTYTGGVIPATHIPHGRHALDAWPEADQDQPMPSKSPAQARMMAAAAHDPAFAKRVGVPQSVAKDYNRADKGRKLAEAMKAHAKRRAADEA
jgi:hypothetical protein